MKLKGEFLIREVTGEIFAIPIGKTALHFNGIICLNAVSKLIWKELQAGETKENILKRMLEVYEVSHEEAASDLEEFLSRLKENNLLED